MFSFFFIAEPLDLERDCFAKSHDAVQLSVHGSCADRLMSLIGLELARAPAVGILHFFLIATQLLPRVSLALPMGELTT